MACADNHIGFTPWLVNNLDRITSRSCVCVGLVILALGFYYKLSADIALKSAIYSITGWVFWKNLYLAGTLVLVSLASMSRIESLTKNKPYVQKEKLELLKRFYADEAIRSHDEVLVIVFSLSFFGFGLSFSIGIFLGLLKLHFL